MNELVTVIDIRSEDGNEVLIEFSNGKIVVLTVKEILAAVASVAVMSMELLN
jgi:hypothetical protein